MRVLQSILFFGFLAFYSAETLSAKEAAPPTDRPNIILIMADDLGYGELGCYGQKEIATPNLDQLAKDGLRFTHFYAGSTVCAPSRCVLMTGLHTGHCRVRGNAGQGDPAPQTLVDEDKTIAEYLRAAGYRTGLIGKWGLGDDPNGPGHPNRQGFDYFFGFLDQMHAHNHYPDYLWENEERVELSNVIEPVGKVGAGYATKKVEYAGDLFSKKALEFVSSDSKSPFFLYLALTVPHANNERTRALGNGQEVPDFGQYAERDWSEQDKGQAAMISRMDRDIGELLKRLDELGLSDSTIVMFTSDNGPHREGGHKPELFSPQAPFRGFKRDLTDGGIRVPFIVRWPGKIAPNRQSDSIGYFGDILPTLCAVAGVKSPEKIDGLSLVDLFRSESAQLPLRTFYWEFHEGGTSQAVVLDGRWKGIRLKKQDAPVLLFDLQNDIRETNDLAAKHPDIVEKVKAVFRSERSENKYWPIRDAK